MRKVVIQSVVATAILVGAYFAVSTSWLKAQDDKSMGSSYAAWDGNGALKRPENWREWIFVGAPVTPHDMNNGKAAFPEFHNVYIDPVSYKVYKQSGKFPDGTILVKELVSVGAKAATSGQGYFQGEFIGLEAAVKSKANHPDEPGNWAYYSFTSKAGEPLKDSSPGFEAVQCNACHQSSAADDWVFTQYYPVLRAAKSMKKN